MPIFDYKCSSCGRVKRDVFVHKHDNFVFCVHCSNEPAYSIHMDKLPAIPNMHLFPVDGIHLKHICPGGKTFHSKNEMKRYAKKHDLELGALL